MKKRAAAPGRSRGASRPARAATEWPKQLCPATWSRSIALNICCSFLGFCMFVVAECWLYHEHHTVACILGAVTVGVAVPLTHSLGRSRYRDWKSWFFQGGGKERAPRNWRWNWRFHTFQAAGWTFFVTALALALAPLARQEAAHDAGKLPSGVSVMAGAAGVISEVFIVGSLLSFQDSKPAPAAGQPAGSPRRRVRPPPEPARGPGGAPVGLRPFLSANLALAAVAAGLAGASFLWEPFPVALFTVTATAAACLAVAVPLTHGLGGRLIHPAGLWSFWQPFEGGKRFVLLQAGGWTLFATAIALFLWGLRIATVRAPGAGRVIAGAGFAGLAAEALLVVSLACFRHPAPEDPAPHRSASPLASASAAWEGEHRMVGGAHGIRGGFRSRLRALAIVLGMYAGQYVTIVAVFAPPLLMSPTRVLLLYAGYVAAYGWTYRGTPHVTGSWHKPELAERMAAYAEDAAWSWFGGVRLVKSFRTRMDPERRYVFGYHPHGLCPATAAWIGHTKEWGELFPGVQPCTLVASVLLLIPIFREMLLWSGVRDVGRRSFRRALEERRHVLVLPGGQAELVVDEKRHDRVTLYTRHRGFVREAIRAGAHVVPMFCFGESRALVNAVRMPALQRWTYRTFGFPVPYIPAGWGAGFLPLPRPTPLSVVVGAPIDVAPPSGLAPDGAEMERHIEQACTAYYTALKALFEVHKHDHGYGGTELVLSHHEGDAVLRPIA